MLPSANAGQYTTLLFWFPCDQWHINVQTFNLLSIGTLYSADVTPSAVHVGNIVQGVRMAWAQGRDLGTVDDDSDAAKKVRNIVLFLSMIADSI